MCWQTRTIHGTSGAKAEAFSCHIVALNFPTAEEIHRIKTARTRIAPYASLDADQIA